MVNDNFCSDKKSGLFLDPFLSKIWPFLLKNQVSDIFFESAHRICLKLGTIALNHRMAVLCLGKFLFWLFWPFLGKKYIACGDIIWFSAKNCFLSLYLRNRASDFDDFFTDVRYYCF